MSAFDPLQTFGVQAKILTMRALVIGLVGILLATFPAHGQRQREAEVRVPFVGCRADGQQGPQPPPKAQRTPLLPKRLAGRLAYYQARGGPGVLAPRGWRCSGLYGSSGSSLRVRPDWAAPRYGVEVVYEFGGTSGRWGVAEAIARYFPSYRRVIPKLTAGFINPHWPSGPYPKDRLSYRSKTLVHFVTPSQATGQGSVAFGNWGQSTRAIQGSVMLVKTADGPDVQYVTIQLPDADRALANVILKQAEASPQPDGLDWPSLK